MTDAVNVKKEYILGLDNTPFFTTNWSPANSEPSAYVVFVHGFSEHIARYDHFMRKLASPPHNIDVFAFDQRGHGRTSLECLTADSPEVKQWQAEGKKVKLEVNAKRLTGGWGKQMPDIEFWVKYRSQLAQSKGKKLFLWGFSMGGGEVIGFCTRPTAPPAESTLNLLSGVMAGGPLVKQTHPAPIWKTKPGTFLAHVGLGNFLIPSGLKAEDLSYNEESNKKVETDPLCEPVGSLRGISDMLSLGALLVTSAPMAKFPKALPLLVYHGEDDPICSFEAAKEFHDGCAAQDKTFYAVKRAKHEPHNECEPTPTEVANFLGEWIAKRAGGPSTNQSVAESKL